VDKNLFYLKLETFKSASAPKTMVSSVPKGKIFYNKSSPSSLTVESRLSAFTHINDLEDEIRSLREKNRKLIVRIKIMI